ncbi:hypothetical protein FQZ97_944810 [compost metagenome]
MPGEVDAPRLQAQPLRQLQPEHPQGDRNAAPGPEHRVEVAVVGVVVVVDVAAKTHVAKEELVERPQPLQRVGGVVAAPAHPGQQLVHVAQHGLHIHLGIFVLRDGGGGFQQRQAVIVGHQRGEIAQGRGRGEFKG